MSRGFRDEDEPDASELFQVTVKHKTEKALLCRFVDGNERWVPISQIHDDSEITEESDKGDEGSLVVTTWLATKWAEE